MPYDWFFRSYYAHASSDIERSLLFVDERQEPLLIAFAKGLQSDGSSTRMQLVTLIQVRTVFGSSPPELYQRAPLGGTRHRLTRRTTAESWSRHSRARSISSTTPNRSKPSRVRRGRVVAKEQNVEAWNG